MNSQHPWNRRTFIKASAGAAGGFLLTLHLERSIAAQDAPPTAPKAYPPDAFIEIRPDGKIVIQVNRLEFGQGVNTALPMLIAEEMDADWSQVITELAPAADVYRDPVRGIQMVGGSGSIATSFQQYRELGARARAMLAAAAAARWNVSPGQCRTEASVVHGPAGQTLRYAELAAEASRQSVPSTVTLKNPGEFRLVGKATRRVDSLPKCNGSQKFGLDLDLPGMKVALVAHPPVFGGKVKNVDDPAARAVTSNDGAVQILQIPIARGGTGVAVVADRFWTAKVARDRLKIEWDLSGVERPDTSQLRSMYRDLSRTPGQTAVMRGDPKAMERFSNRIIAEYEFPFLAHVPMEPLNTTVRFDGDRAEAWAGSQFQTVDQAAIAETLGLPVDRVTFHTEMAGGGFGRRAVADSHVQREAAEIAKRMPGVPVKLIWTREDDVQGGYYRPMHFHRVEIGVGPDGMPAAWRHVIVGQSILTGTQFEFMVKNGVDAVAVEGAADTPYAIPNFIVSAHHPKVNVPVLWWRSVGHTHTAFVMETLIDELASRARVEPIAYRRKLLSSEARRPRSVLDLLDEKTAAWRNRPPRNHAVGVACHESFGTAVACAVDVSVEGGRPKIHRAAVTSNSGFVVNPLTIESQMQGGLVFGLTQLMANGAITLRDGRVDQRNFDGFTPPYMGDAPASVEVYMVSSNEPPTGAGEPPVPVIAPAVANALAKLTGKRYRTLPLASL